MKRRIKRDKRADLGRANSLRPASARIFCFILFFLIFKTLVYRLDVEDCSWVFVGGLHVAEKQAVCICVGFVRGLYKRGRHVCRTQEEKTGPESVSLFYIRFIVSSDAVDWKYPHLNILILKCVTSLCEMWGFQTHLQPGWTYITWTRVHLFIYFFIMYLCSERLKSHPL